MRGGWVLPNEWTPTLLRLYSASRQRGVGVVQQVEDVGGGPMVLNRGLRPSSSLASAEAESARVWRCCHRTRRWYTYYSTPLHVALANHLYSSLLQLVGQLKCPGHVTVPPEPPYRVKVCVGSGCSAFQLLRL